MSANRIGTAVGRDASYASARMPARSTPIEWVISRETSP